MNLQVVYCNHQTAGLDIREKLAFSSKEQLDSAYSVLKKSYPETEMVVISTCNRVELYTATQETESGPSHQDLAKFFSEFHQVPVSDFFEDFLERTGPDAVRHLFQVASSLDSMVLGEPQIVNQVKEAYQRATDNSLCGPLDTCVVSAGDSCFRSCAYRGHNFLKVAFRLPVWQWAHSEKGFLNALIIKRF